MLAPPAQSSPPPLAAEDRRLRAHFAAVLAELRARPSAAVAPAAAAPRRAMIAALAAYAERGVFPRNLDFPDRAEPYFVDAVGTRCAVAHLMDASGEGALVDAVRRERNHARVAELAADPRVTAWLDRVGLSAAEAARIQPEYCFQSVVQCVCAAASPAMPTVAEIHVDAVDAASATGHVVAVWGDPQVAVGDTLTVPLTTSIGAELLVRLNEAGEPERVSTVRGHDAVLACMSGTTHALPKEDVAVSWVADDCESAFRAANPNADTSICDDTATGDASGGGCGSGPAPDAAGIASGLAAAAWLARRRRAASPTG
ncbi:MAG: hypothetical protein U1F43_04210 [Myxococcota bacterium]